MFKVGVVLLFIASALASLLVLVLENVPANSIVTRVVSGVATLILYLFATEGAAACLITILQLGLD